MEHYKAHWLKQDHEAKDFCLQENPSAYEGDSTTIPELNEGPDRMKNQKPEGKAE